MIQTQFSKDELRSRLQGLHLHGERALRTYAGFAANSPYAGQARQTFSLVLSQADIDYMQQAMQQLYDRLRADLVDQPPAGCIPFDFIRIDAYYDTTERQLQILEINSRDAGMHEVCEWLDSKVVQVTDGIIAFNLNDRIAINQKSWHEAHLGPVDRVLYMSRAAIPRWLYYEALDRHYPQLADLNSWHDVSYSDQGIVYGEDVFRAVITKAANWTPEIVKGLDRAGTVSVVQSRQNGHLGDKKYLEQLDLPFVTQSIALDAAKHEEYLTQQVDLVLKLNKSSGSRGVTLGRSVTAEAWATQLQTAYSVATDWTMQRYAQPGNGDCLPHGQPARDCRVLLGIFMLPKPDDPSQIDIEIVAKGYVGPDEAVLFDPAGHKADIWFGNVIVAAD